MIKGWTYLKLSEKEIEEAQAKLREYNLKIMKQCLEDSRELMKDTPHEMISLKLANALFEKLSISSFTTLMDTVQRKAEKLRSPSVEHKEIDATPVDDKMGQIINRRRENK